MKNQRLGHRIMAVGSGAVVGAIGGVLLADLGHVISSSATGIAGTVIMACAIGAWTNRLPGIVMGAIGAVLLIAFGSVIGGSMLGVGLTTAAGAVLGGWCRWPPRRDFEAHAAALPDSLRRLCDVSEDTMIVQRTKELAL